MHLIRQWNVRCLLLITTKHKLLIWADLKLLDKYLGFKKVIQSIIASYAYGIAVLIASSLSKKCVHHDKDHSQNPTMFCSTLLLNKDATSTSSYQSQPNEELCWSIGQGGEGFAFFHEKFPQKKQKLQQVYLMALK